MTLADKIKDFGRYWSGIDDFKRWKGVGRNDGETHFALSNLAIKVTITAFEGSWILGVAIPEAWYGQYLTALKEVRNVLFCCESTRLIEHLFFRGMEKWYGDSNRIHY